jgi:hypothetical protein
MSELIEKMTSFLSERGIPSRLQTLEGDGFLPGLEIEQGTLLIDAEKLKWPGDILHEAAHIALNPPSLRTTISGKLEVSPADEMAALAWSYAAAVALEIDPHIVFHEGGYKTGGAQLVSQFSAVATGQTPVAPGVPMLQWYRMCQQFPVMNSWLREIEDPTAA